METLEDEEEDDAHEAGASRSVPPANAPRAAAEGRNTGSGSKGAGRGARNAPTPQRSGSRGRKQAPAAANPDALAKGISDALERARLEDPPPLRAVAPQPKLRIEHGFGEPGAKSGGLGPAREVAELSIELKRLGVPETDRGFVGIAMVDLARRLDSGDVNWIEIREAVSLVMHYPGLARRVLPLLLPYFEAAA